MADMSLLEVRAFAGKRYRCDVRQAVACFLIDGPCPKRRTSVDPTCRYVPDEEAAYQLRPKAKDRTGRNCTSRSIRRAFAPRNSVRHRLIVPKSFSEPASPYSRRPQARS